MKEDPLETNNLIFDPKHQDVVKKMNKQLFDVMEGTGAMYIPLYRDVGGQSNRRVEGGSKRADFPTQLTMPPKPPEP